MIKRWPDYNTDGVAAKFEVVNNDMSKLPDAVVTALGKCHRNMSGLNPANDVNWNVCIMSTDGATSLDSDYLEGGSKSGIGCAEDALWVKEKSGEEKERNIPHAKGCAFFKYSAAIYIIDGGLCPCRRCCGSFIGLAKSLNSYIVVRPLVDYEFIDRSQTPLTIDMDINKHTYFLLFKPDAAFFTIFHESDDHAPTFLLSQIKPEVVVSKSIVVFGCNKGHFAKIDYGPAKIVQGERLKCKGQHCPGTLLALGTEVPLGRKFTEHLRTAMEEKK